MTRPRAAASMLAVIVALAITMVLMALSANAYLNSTPGAAGRGLPGTPTPTAPGPTPRAQALALATEALASPSADDALRSYPRSTPAGEASARVVGTDLEVSVAGSSACARMSLATALATRC